jgi:hypothetical protein
MADQAPRSAGTLEDPLDEALRIIARARERGLTVRLMGGLAIHALVPEWQASIARDGRDIDLATRGRDSRELARLLDDLGYVADKQYNALYGHKQLYFTDAPRERPLDVLVDKLEMCHRLEFGERLTLSDPTLPPTDLLLTKLQIVKITRKDLIDILALLSELPVVASEEGANQIGLDRITAITGQDWGWWRTVTGNLEKLRAFIHEDLRPDELELGRPPRFHLDEQLDRIRAAIDEAPKTTRWRLRARIGDRMPWYEEPEEVGHGR